jgi:hypothetical protein
MQIQTLTTPMLRKGRPALARTTRLRLLRRLTALVVPKRLRQHFAEQLQLSIGVPTRSTSVPTSANVTRDKRHVVTRKCRQSPRNRVQPWRLPFPATAHVQSCLELTASTMALNKITIERNQRILLDLVAQPGNGRCLHPLMMVNNQVQMSARIARSKTLDGHPTVSEYLYGMACFNYAPTPLIYMVA